MEIFGTWEKELKAAETADLVVGHSRGLGAEFRASDRAGVW